MKKIAVFFPPDWCRDGMSSQQIQSSDSTHLQQHSYYNYVMFYKWLIEEIPEPRMKEKQTRQTNQKTNY